MRVCVAGLWHLGTVTASCLAAGGHDVVGFDDDREVVEKLQAGTPPILEPGLEDLVRRGLNEGRLRFTSDPAEALRGAKVVWVTYDTPVTVDDRADVEFVVERVSTLFPHLSAGSLVLISSQLPIGTTARLERTQGEEFPKKRITFACSPENLRLGKAIQSFTEPERVVVGLRSPADRELVVELLRPFSDRIEWMSVESAEMTKHALNAFLATSVAFINEVGVLSERLGADAKEVERGLKTDPRIGPKAYLSAGAAFAGGTLARDVRYLSEIGKELQLPVDLLSAVWTSNEAHKRWVHRKLQHSLGDLRGKKVAVWGLTYKPDTDTLRRSASVELCEWLSSQGALVQAHDPAIKELPDELEQSIRLFHDPVTALSDAVALVVATEWPEFADIDLDAIVSRMISPIVIDPNRFLSKSMESDPRIRYVTVGKPQ